MEKSEDEVFTVDASHRVMFVTLISRLCIHFGAEPFSSHGGVHQTLLRGIIMPSPKNTLLTSTSTASSCRSNGSKTPPSTENPSWSVALRPVAVSLHRHRMKRARRRSICNANCHGPATLPTPGHRQGTLRRLYEILKQVYQRIMELAPVVERASIDEM